MNSSFVCMYLTLGFSSILCASTEIIASVMSSAVTVFLFARNAFACARSYIPIDALTLGFLSMFLCSRSILTNSIARASKSSSKVTVNFCPLSSTILFSMSRLSGYPMWTMSNLSMKTSDSFSVAAVSSGFIVPMKMKFAGSSTVYAPNVAFPSSRTCNSAFCSFSGHLFTSSKNSIP